MHYKVLAYRIKRRTAVLEIGLAPYMGHDITPEVLKGFIMKHFTGPEDSYQGIEVEEYRTFDTEHEWIYNVHNMLTFEYLQKSEDFAGDILEKYGLPRELEYRVPKAQEIEQISKRADMLRQQLQESIAGFSRKRKA